MDAPVVDLMRQFRLLEEEYAWEREWFEEETRRAGVERRVRQGVCWWPTRVGNVRYNSLNQTIVDVWREAGEEVDHVFEYGRPVCFFETRGDGSLAYARWQGVVSYVDGDRMVVVVPSGEAVAGLAGWSGEVGVQLYFDNRSYQAMFEALRGVMSAREGRLARLREVLLGVERPGWRELPRVRLPWLNGEQETAVNRVLAARDVAVVHGPPGTGKTTTLVEAVHETLRREAQVLVCAQSNTAVDWIAEKLVDRGVTVLRVGNPTRVNEKMLSFTYERRFEAHPLYGRLRRLRTEERELLGRTRGTKGREGALARLRRVREEAVDLEVEIDRALFDEAKVVACTLVGASNRLLAGRRFSSLFIDEAGQALEAACWIGIARADRVVLAGDFQQLPPTVKCPGAARGGLGRTLLERVARRLPECVMMLRVQYRMHEDIMGFPSRWFYGGRLLAAPGVGDRGILAWDAAVEWVDTSGAGMEEGVVEGRFGRVNRAEAELVVRLLRRYVERIGAERVVEEAIDFGVISPYRAQVYCLRRLLRADAVLGDKRVRGRLTVHTVDGFQGQERDVVVISLVRANEAGDIGFLRDLRRMNVAMTRARMKLVIVGDASTLGRHAFYRALHDYVAERGKVVEWTAFGDS